MKVFLFFILSISAAAQADSGSQAKLAGLAKGSMAGKAEAQSPGLSAQDLGAILSNNEVITFLDERPITHLSVKLAPKMPEFTAFVISVSVNDSNGIKSNNSRVGDGSGRHCIINIVAFRSSKDPTSDFEVIITEICEMEAQDSN
jgi:hypothetical protein